MTLLEFVKQRIAKLDARVKEEKVRASQNPTDEAIHDLRVSIRRYRQALRSLENVISAGESKQKRRLLRSTMELTAEVRNRDIALELLRKAGAGDSSRLAAKLRRQRDAACKRLVRSIRPRRTGLPS